MPHGFPDYGIAAPSEYVFPIVSWEDYFMRQGLIKTLDGNGDIIFFDSFEGGLSKWFQSAGAGANYIELSPDHARGGNWALKLNLAGTAWSSVEAAATIPVAAANRFGFESSFTMHGNYYSPAWYLYYYDLTKFYSFGVRYNASTGKLQYWTHPDTWTNFADVTWEVNPLYYFHPVKLVIDASKLEYVKFIARGVTYDMSGKTPPWDTQTSRRAIQPRFMWTLISGEYFPSYLDDVIVTQNEP